MNRVANPFLLNAMPESPILSLQLELQLAAIINSEKYLGGMLAPVPRRRGSFFDPV